MMDSDEYKKAGDKIKKGCPEGDPTPEVIDKMAYIDFACSMGYVAFDPLEASQLLKDWRLAEMNFYIACYEIYKQNRPKKVNDGVLR